MNALVDLAGAGFRYTRGAAAGTGVEDVDLVVGAGQVVALVGPSGCGKTTVTRLINGLAPHHVGGELTGTVRVAGRDVATSTLAELAAEVGSVFQNPRSQFFTADVPSELAFTGENLGRPVAEMERAVRRAVTEFGLAPILDRSLHALSGGERQKVACGSAGVIGPQVLVLDEPTANLDHAAVEDLRRAVAGWKRSGRAVVVAEHRLAWLDGLVDTWVVMADGKVVDVLPASGAARLEPQRAADLGLRGLRPVSWGRRPVADPGPEALVIEGLTRRYRKAAAPALAIDHLAVPAGSVVAVTGPNGAGKSTLVRSLVGTDRRARGRVLFGGRALSRSDRLREFYLILQDVNHQLFAETVAEEIRLSSPDIDDRRLGAVLDDLGLAGLADRHPMSLSGGQKQRVAIAGALATGRTVLVLDEPTSGLDLRHMRQVADLLTALAADGVSVLVVTHDRDLVATCCTHELRLEAGRVVGFEEIVPGT
jgi:energy-coupling factor transporter ATP-binding protein EcfA2